MTRLRYGALIFTLSLSVTGAFAQKGSGAKFGAHDPRTCASRKEPVKGAPTAAQLKQYVICDNEFFQPGGASGALLYLVSDVTVEVSKGRPFNILTDSWPDVDPSGTIYRIRGGYTSYQCQEPQGRINGAYLPNAPIPGKNCFKYAAPPPAATGQCYKDTFGDWHCKICCAASSSGSRVEFFAPPTGQ